MKKCICRLFPIKFGLKTNTDSDNKLKHYLPNYNILYS